MFRSDCILTHASDAGIAANGIDLTSDNSGAPHGNQVGFIANNGLISQIWTVETSGSYALSFMVAQRATGNDSYQRLKVSLRPSSAASTAKTFVWSGNIIAEERDSTGTTVRKRFFAEGEQRIGGKDEGRYYYSRDHLGSIREVTNENGEPVAKFDYDPWGKSVVVTGNMNVDFGYTGHYFHQPSGLNLAMYRAYSPAMGRWISRDPIGENGGVNVYEYVTNDPIDLWDPLGLRDYSAIESQRFILIAYRDATAGSFAGLLNLASHSIGDFDFKVNQSFDWFCVNGEWLSAPQFGNYVAGLGGAAYDRAYSSGLAPTAGLGVITAGFVYHFGEGVRNLLGFKDAERDFLNRTGRPFIEAGYNAGLQFPSHLGRPKECPCRR